MQAYLNISLSPILPVKYIFYISNKYVGVRLRKWRFESWVWWHIAIIPALWKLRQEDLAFKGNLSYSVSSRSP
jgi:hypothetical protein